MSDVRGAARKWAEEGQHKFADFRQPKLQPSMEWMTTARCFKHEGCFSNDGKAFQFLGSLTEDEQFYKLKIASAGACNGRENSRKPAAAGSGKTGPAVTVEDREAVLSAANFLAAGLKATPTAIHVRIAAMKRPRVLDSAVRSILRWRKKKYGPCKPECLGSEGAFRAYAEQHSDPEGAGSPLYFSHVAFKTFAWICFFVPFLQALQENKHAQSQLGRWCLTADYTFKVEFLGYSCWSRRLVCLTTKSI